MRIKNNTLTPIAVLSHPLAYRIVTALGMRGPQTTTNLERILHDAPTSSLYRQLARLRNTGVLRVVGERKARGAIERTYAMSSREGASFATRDLAAVPVAELRATLQNFITTLAADVSTFVASPAFARNRLFVNAGLTITNLTDNEYRDTVRKLNAVLMRRKRHTVAKTSEKRRYFYLVALPEMAKP